MHTQTTAEIIARIRKIEIHTKTLVNDIFGGEYHSLFKGQGLEFAEVREYQAGDSYRDIDWNVSARFGTPFIKKFCETRELNVLFVLDISGSQNFGTRSMLKKERLAEIAAVLSFSALSNNDKVGMVMFSDQLEKYLSPRKGRNHTLQILRDILYLEPKSQRTSLKSAFEYANRILKKKSIVFILSDFMDAGYDKPLQILAQKHDVIAMQILDDAEVRLPNAGILRIIDPESGETMYLNSSNPLIRRQYDRMVMAEQEQLQSRLKHLKVDFLSIKSSDSYSQVLRGFFAKRRKALRNRR
ncbi:MAG: DUF58 domain-containing protein [Candidatus Cloacimonetes bacterium HGW-Cloacimonetes-1]|jgi:uncharacterized protein (DUF58 family)|nr:MAG: DUF58 domain-containing protein [Candidatus Cloacimonetes bacterium HGW-Cloacimonetes-1]